MGKVTCSNCNRMVDLQKEPEHFDNKCMCTKITKYDLIDEIMNYSDKLPNEHFIAIGEICKKYDNRVN